MPPAVNAITDRPAPGNDAVAAKAPSGNRLLMCPPTAYALKYEINPWMSLKNTPDVPSAVSQWAELRRVLAE
ncbi:MAG TPA: hypothetical protein VGS41_14975, partial [Chthonomonadales bacterium]|nr:hypothetical protein [Chthonomonadales bacterium]